MPGKNSGTLWFVSAWKWTFLARSFRGRNWKHPLFVLLFFFVFSIVLDFSPILDDRSSIRESLTNGRPIFFTVSLSFSDPSIKNESISSCPGSQKSTYYSLPIPKWINIRIISRHNSRLDSRKIAPVTMATNWHQWKGKSSLNQQLIGLDWI